MTCPRCNGKKGTFEVGLGPNGLVPTYYPCPLCQGTGWIEDDYYAAGDEADVCPRCNGRGTIIDIGIGMSSHGPVPGYVEVTCPECGGTGEVILE